MHSKDGASTTAFAVRSTSSGLSCAARSDEVWAASGTVAGPECDDSISAYQASMERACLVLLSRGWENEELYSAQLFDLPPGAQKESLLQRRDDLGLSVDPQAYLMSDPAGERIADSGVPLQSRLRSS